MEDQESVIPEYPDKGRGKQRIGPGLGKEYPAVPGLFEEDALRPGVEVVVVPDQVDLSVFQVEVMGDALGQGVVDRLVGEQEILVDSREVDE